MTFIFIASVLVLIEVRLLTYNHFFRLKLFSAGLTIKTANNAEWALAPCVCWEVKWLWPSSQMLVDTVPTFDVFRILHKGVKGHFLWSTLVENIYKCLHLGYMCRGPVLLKYCYHTFLLHPWAKCKFLLLLTCVPCFMSLSTFRLLKCDSFR